MSVRNKIFEYFFIWAIVSAAVFFYVVPKFTQSLVDLQNSHQAQIDQLNKLQAQASNLHKMQIDLDTIAQDPVQPSDLFKSDVHLVNEFKYLEDVAAKTNNKLELTVSGTVEQELPAEGTVSGLVTVPYSMNLIGTYQNVTTFVKYMENAYFLSPISGLNLNKHTATPGQIEANILTNTFITK